MTREEKVAYALCKTQYEQANRSPHRDGPMSEQSICYAVEQEFRRPWWIERAKAAIEAMG
jgi:hypothetical protein